MKRLGALLLAALLVSVAASCAVAAVTLSGSYYPATADENFTVTLSQNGVSDVECYSSQYIKSWVEDEMSVGFYDSLESPAAGEIMSVFALSDIKAPASVDSVFYNGVPDAIASEIASLQLYFITEMMEEPYTLTTVASMPLAGAYDESKKMIALTQLPDALLARLADWDSNLVNGGEVGANAKLMSDIDLGGEPWTPIGTGPYPKAYEGTFDGGGFTVSGVNVNNGVEDPWLGMCAGFFGFTYGNVKNLNVSGEIAAESSGDIFIGGIAGSVQYDSYIPNGANITNCSFSGSVSADSTGGHVRAGGVVGQTVGIVRAKIAGCTYTGGSVTAVCGGQGSNNIVGGIVGQADSSTVVDSCTASSEKISASGESALNMAGGIAGELKYARMTNCTAASAAISAEGTNSNDAGGITGNAFNGQITGCTYTGGAGSITAKGGENNNIGGISGALEDSSSVSNCAWNGDSSEKATGKGDYCVDEETTTALPAEEFESGEIILSVIPACPVVNLTPGGSSTLSFTAYPGGKPLTQEQAAKYISVPETAYSTFSIDTSVWPYVVKATDAIGTEELVFSLYATNLVTGEPADAPTGNVTITVANAETPAVPVAEINITPAELSMLVGGTQQLAAVVIPANATNNNVVTWGGGDAAVATVDENGLVTAHGIGTTTITATAGGVSASCSVTADVIHVESVSIDQTELQLTVGEKATLSAAITPENAADKNVTWSSDDAAVATVDENGLVTAHGIGTTTITATTADGGKTATCAVTVSASPQPAPPSGGGGGGCSAGFGALALLAVVPLFARRKK